LVASAARVFGSQVRLAVAPERIPRDTEALREAALQRPEPPAASKDFEPSKNRFKINHHERSMLGKTGFARLRTSVSWSTRLAAGVVVNGA
jgi:hypothetical protein